MLIDIHTHAFPEKIAERAIDTLSHASGGLIPQHKGTLASLKEEMAKDGVDISVVLGIATNPHQQTNVNNFAAEMNKDEKIIASLSTPLMSMMIEPAEKDPDSSYKYLVLPCKLKD